MMLPDVPLVHTSLNRVRQMVFVFPPPAAMSVQFVVAAIVKEATSTPQVLITPGEFVQFTVNTTGLNVLVHGHGLVGAAALPGAHVPVIGLTGVHAPEPALYW
jgi:hypothetical protein